MYSNNLDINTRCQNWNKAGEIMCGLSVTPRGSIESASFVYQDNF